MSTDRFTRASRTSLFLIIAAMLIAAANSTSATVVGWCLVTILLAIIIGAVAYGKS